MTERLEMVAVGVSLAILLIVLELVRRRKLTEEYSFLWILASFGLLVLSLKHDWLAVVTGALGVASPGAALLLLLVAAILAASICFSVIVSRQRQQIERLIEETAILSAELRDLREESAQPPAIVRRQLKVDPLHPGSSKKPERIN